MEPGTRQLHGLACALFEGEGARHLGQEKPFAVWPLRPAQEGSGQDWILRATWLAAGPPPAALFASSELRVGHVTYAVTETTHRSVTHKRLVEGPPLEEAQLAFRSPTYFSQNGTDVVLPDPRLIVGSWRRRWNASLPDADALAISDDAWREINRAIRLSAFDLRTRQLDSGRGHERAGFTGTATLQIAKDASPAVRSEFSTLVRFAEFCGTGAQTTHGFGATTVAAGSPDPHG